MVRRIADAAGIAYADPSPFSDGTLAEALLTPTRLYVKPLLAALKLGGIHALAHITGGGLTENLPRVLPSDLGADITLGWPRPPVFDWLEAAGPVAPEEMLRTFNCGIGMCVVVAADRADEIAAVLRAEGETVHTLGSVTPGAGIRFA